MIESEGEQIYPRKDKATGKVKRLEDRRWKLVMSKGYGYGYVSTEYHIFKLFAKISAWVLCSGSSPLYTKAVIIDQKPKDPNRTFRVTEIE